MKTSKRRHIDCYEIGKKIGEGTFGKVRLGRNITTGEQVAIKIVNYKKVKSSEERKLIEREKKALTLLNHPNIVKLYKVIDDEERGVSYMILEYVSGGELFDYIVEHGRIKEKDARKFIREMISALEYCHSHLIVHRDLKPENLLLSETLNIKITDFGLSNIISPGKKFSTFCGSLHYACPEILKGEEYVGPGADIWAMGVILYCLVTGCQPWRGKTSKDILNQIIHKDIQLPSWISSECSNLILNMLQLKEKDRITIEEMRRHPWVMKDYDEPPPSYLPTYNGVYFVYEDVIKQLEDIGFKIGEKEINEIKKGGKTQLVATYHLLLKRREEMMKERTIKLLRENQRKVEKDFNLLNDHLSECITTRTIVLEDEAEEYENKKRSESEESNLNYNDYHYRENAGSDAILNIQSPLIKKDIKEDEYESPKKPLLNIEDIPRLNVKRSSKASPFRKTMSRKSILINVFSCNGYMKEKKHESPIKYESQQIEEMLKTIEDLKFKLTKLNCFKCEYKGTKFELEISNELKADQKGGKLKLSRVRGDLFNYRNVCEKILNHM